MYNDEKTQARVDALAAQQVAVQEARERLHRETNLTPYRLYEEADGTLSRIPKELTQSMYNDIRLILDATAPTPAFDFEVEKVKNETT